MKEWGLAIEGGLLIGCAWTLAAIALAVLGVRIVRSWLVWRRKRRRLALGALAVAAIIVGGTKPPQATWDQGLHDAGSEIDTNDMRRVTFRWTYEPWIPDVATFKLSYVTKADPEPEPVLVASCPITDLILSVVMESDATNYLFFAEQSFIPDVPVVTNGVYHVQCVGGTNVWIPIGLKIYEGERSIAPPETTNGETP